MRHICQIFRGQLRSLCSAALILGLICGLTLPAESLSVKLRGKIGLGVVLAGVAYATHTLVKRDRRAVERLQRHFGPPDRVISYQRGFDRWEYRDYGERRYLFRNNRLIKTGPIIRPFSEDQGQVYLGRCRCASVSPFLTDTTVSGVPMRSRLSLSLPRRAPQLGSSCLGRLGAGRWLALNPWLSRSWL